MHNNVPYMKTSLCTNIQPNSTNFNFNHKSSLTSFFHLALQLTPGNYKHIHIVTMYTSYTYIGRDIIGGFVLMSPRFFSSPSKSPPARVHRWYTSRKGLNTKKS